MQKAKSNELEDMCRLSTSVSHHSQGDTLLSKFNIPINHVDYSYIEKCKDDKELGQILQILKSGEEGYFPDLIKFTEERLAKINPKHKLLRRTCPVINRNSVPKDELKEIDSDLNEWLKSISTNDKELEHRKIKLPDYEDCPQIRENFKSKTNDENKGNVAKRIASTDYENWDKFDPDAELIKMEIEEEKMRKEALAKEQEEKRKKSQHKKTVTFNKFATEAEAIFESNREKEKGNEYFKVGEYKEAYDHYTKSIKYKPSVANYNNRAIAGLKLYKYEEALEDCQCALAIEPDNVKALIRRAMALEGLKRYKEALISVEKAINLDPNNAYAQELAHKMRQFDGTKLKNKRFIIEDMSMKM